jgi:hypothetical protein
MAPDATKVCRSRELLLRTSTPNRRTELAKIVRLTSMVIRSGMRLLSD